MAKNRFLVGFLASLLAFCIFFVFLPEGVSGSLVIEGHTGASPEFDGESSEAQNKEQDYYESNKHILDAVESKLKAKINHNYDQLSVQLAELSKLLKAGNKEIKEVKGKVSEVEKKQQDKTEITELRKSIENLQNENAKISETIPETLRTEMRKKWLDQERAIDNLGRDIDAVTNDINGILKHAKNKLEEQLGLMLMKGTVDLNTSLQLLSKKKDDMRNAFAALSDDMVILKKKFEDTRAELIANMTELSNSMRETHEVAFNDYANFVKQKAEEKYEEYQKQINAASLDQEYIRTLLSMCADQLNKEKIFAVNLQQLFVDKDSEVIRQIFLTELQHRYKFGSDLMPIFIFTRQDQKIDLEEFNYYMIPSKKMLKEIVKVMKNDKKAEYGVMIIDGPSIKFFTVFSRNELHLMPDESDIRMESIERYDKEITLALSQYTQSDLLEEPLDNPSSSISSKGDKNKKILFAYVGKASDALYYPKKSLKSCARQLEVGKYLSFNTRSPCVPTCNLWKQMDKEMILLKRMEEARIVANEDEPVYRWTSLLKDKDMLVRVVKGRMPDPPTLPFSPFFRDGALLLRIEIVNQVPGKGENYLYPSDLLINHAINELVKRSKVIGGTYAVLDSQITSKGSLFSFFGQANGQSTLKIFDMENPGGREIKAEKGSVDKNKCVENICKDIYDSLTTSIIPRQFKAPLRGKVLLVHICEKNVDCD